MSPPVGVMRALTREKPLLGLRVMMPVRIRLMHALVAVSLLVLQLTDAGPVGTSRSPIYEMCGCVREAETATCR
jgi:hypothetical protein